MKEIVKIVLYKLNIMKLIYMCFFIFPIKTKKVVCSNFDGKPYGESPKAIAEKLKDKKFEIIWVYSGNTPEMFPEYIQLVKPYTWRYFYELATAKFWIFNTRKKNFLKKRKNQIYIQTWHGCIALKKIEYDVFNELSESYKLDMKEDSADIDLFVSSNKIFSKQCETAFHYYGEILEFGTPKNDILITNDENKLNYKDVICNNLNIEKNSKIILYAPTFRKNYHNNPYNIDFDNILNHLETLVEENWVVLIKFHPNFNEIENYKYNNSNIKILQDINLGISELILGSDLIITDYSSIMFDAMIAEKKVILYMNDYEDYMDDRGMYLKLEELPFDIVENNSDLVKIIEQSINDSTFFSKYEKFKQMIGLNETGKSSEKIVKYICNKVEEKNGK